VAKDVCERGIQQQTLQIALDRGLKGVELIDFLSKVQENASVRPATAQTSGEGSGDEEANTVPECEAGKGKGMADGRGSCGNTSNAGHVSLASASSSITGVVGREAGRTPAAPAESLAKPTVYLALCRLKLEEYATTFNELGYDGTPCVPTRQHPYLPAFLNDSPHRANPSRQISTISCSSMTWHSRRWQRRSA